MEHPTIVKSEKKLRLAKAHTAIHFYASATSIGSAVGVLVPGLSVLGSTISLPLGIAAMVSSLAKLFDYKWDESSRTAILPSILGYIIGSLGAGAIPGFIPIVGGAFDASATFITVETIGWGTYFIFDSGREPARLSKSEIASLIRKGVIYAERGMASEDLDWLEELPPHMKQQYAKLVTSIADLNLSDDQRLSLLEEIDDLIKPCALFYL